MEGCDFPLGVTGDMEDGIEILISYVQALELALDVVCRLLAESSHADVAQLPGRFTDDTDTCSMNDQRITESVERGVPEQPKSS